MQQYKIDILNLNRNGAVRSDCADITFVNSGTATITINNALQITTGNSLTISANNNEIDRTIYNYFFTGGGSQVLVVFRKIYI
jgi:hypothetical protein